MVLFRSFLEFFSQLQDYHKILTTFADHHLVRVNLPLFSTDCPVGLSLL